MIIVEDAGRLSKGSSSPKPSGYCRNRNNKNITRSRSNCHCLRWRRYTVVRDGNRLRGVGAVIDKDFASSLLAEKLDVDTFVVLTAVEKVAIKFGKPDQEWLSELTVETAEKYIAQKEFAEGSMLPKVQAALSFATSRAGRKALITSLEKAAEGLAGKTGTWIRS